jgi:fermentation-respiration switch protein FrsA (DUF1100 family)
MTRRLVVPLVLAGGAVLALAVAGCTEGGPGPSGPPTTAPVTVAPAPGGIQNGPAPTLDSVSAATGPYRYTTKNVTGPDFASSTLYTPSGLSSTGKWGGIILIPPDLGNNSAFAQRYASNGFVVLSLNAQSTGDDQTARATQAKAALSVLKAQPTVDAARIGVGGSSMGGGATMQLVDADPSFKAAVPMVPLNPGKTYPNDRVPTLIFGGSADTEAPPAQNATVFFNSIPAATPHGLAIVSGATHFIPNTPTAGFTQLAVAWMKYYIDGDTRYLPFITSQPDGLSAFKLVGVT